MTQVEIEAKIVSLRKDYNIATKEIRSKIANIVATREGEINDIYTDMCDRMISLKNKRFELNARQEEFYIEGDVAKSNKLKLQRNDVDRQVCVLRIETKKRIADIRYRMSDELRYYNDLLREKTDKYCEEKESLILQIKNIKKDGNN